MNVSLTQELENLVNKKVKSGLYHSASEVIREGLRLLQERDAIKDYKMQELKREISLGLEQAESENLLDFDIKRIKFDGRKSLKSK